MTEHSHPVGRGCSVGCPAHGMPPTPPLPPPSGMGSPSRVRPSHETSLRSIWRDLAKKRIEDGVDWPRIVLDLLRSLDEAEQRIVIALEASYWDRPYDTRIEAIRNELQAGR